MAARDESDLRQQLHNQYQHLATSATAFDNGSNSESARLASTLRLLIRETAESKSLLGQLGLRDQLEFLDTADLFQAPRLELHTGLTYLRVGGDRPVFVSRLLGPPASQVRLGFPFVYRADCWIPIHAWLDRAVIAEPGGANVYTAQQLIGWLADKDGGAHIDPALPDDYEALSRKNSLRVHTTPLAWGTSMLSINDDLAPPGTEAESPVPAAVRQLAFEMMWTLHSHVGEPAPDHRPRVAPVEIAYER